MGTKNLNSRPLCPVTVPCVLRLSPVSCDWPVLLSSHSLLPKLAEEYMRDAAMTRNAPSKYAHSLLENSLAQSRGQLATLHDRGSTVESTMAASKNSDSHPFSSGM